MNDEAWLTNGRAKRNSRVMFMMGVGNSGVEVVFYSYRLNADDTFPTSPPLFPSPKQLSRL